VIPCCTLQLQLLASKLGLDASRLVLFCSDRVLAERMWFNPEGLAGLMEFVEGLVAPQSFVSVVQVRILSALSAIVLRTTHCWSCTGGGLTVS
jgi:hypothetical protein